MGVALGRHRVDEAHLVGQLAEPRKQFAGHRAALTPRPAATSSALAGRPKAISIARAARLVDQAPAHGEDRVAERLRLEPPGRITPHEPRGRVGSQAVVPGRARLAVGPAGDDQPLQPLEPPSVGGIDQFARQPVEQPAVARQAAVGAGGVVGGAPRLGEVRRLALRQVVDHQRAAEPGDRLQCRDPPVKGRQFGLHRLERPLPLLVVGRPDLTLAVLHPLENRLQAAGVRLRHGGRTCGRGSGRSPPSGRGTPSRPCSPCRAVRRPAGSP